LHLPRPKFRKRLGPLEERPFRLLWLGQGVSAIGDALIAVALAFAVLSDLDGSATELGVVFAAYTVSRVVFILAGGVWADRLPRRLVMLTADLVRVVTQGLTALVLLAGVAQLWQLVVAATIAGSAQAFFGPASTGFVPETVSPGRLQQANALMGLSRSASEVVGPALSGVIIATAGTGWAFALDSATFAVSAAFLLAIRTPGRAVQSERQTFLRDLARGWREIVSRTWLWTSFIAFSLGNFGIAAFVILGSLIARDELGGASDWGLIVTGGAIGGILAGAVALRYRPQRPLVPGFASLLLTPLPLILLVRPFPALVLAVASALSWGSVAFFNALWETVLQQQIPAEALSRVSSYDWMVSLVLMPIGFALAGPTADWLGVDATLWLAAALSGIPVLGVLALPSVRAVRTKPAKLTAEPALLVGEDPVLGRH
jgi:MFS family permease